MIETLCAICATTITETNDSSEHVLQNFLGGRLETSGFLCRDCNSITGHSWDSALAKQLNPLALFFRVVRERGETPGRTVTTSAGEHLRIKSDGSLEPDRARYTITETPEGPRLAITAPDMRSARELLEGLKRGKYPKLDVESALSQAVEQRTYPQGAIMVQGQIGGRSEGRAIVKSAAALAHLSGVRFENCEQAARYLRTEEGEPCFGYYTTTDLVANRPVGVPLNCVAVAGDPATKLLLGYVEYFGIHRIVICLSDRYAGEAFESCYAVDPTSGAKLDLAVSLPFAREDIADIFDYKHADHNAYAQNAAPVLEAAIKKNHRQELERVAGNAVRVALDASGLKPGDLIGPEHAAKIAGRAAHEMIPFILHNIQRRRIPPQAPPAAAEGGD